MYFAILFSITTLISGGLLLWLYTPNGKKWLRDL
jgi:hypothetical protein